MIDDVRGIIERGIHSLSDALPELRKLASQLRKPKSRYTPFRMASDLNTNKRFFMNNNLKVIKNPTETEINYIKNELKKYNDKLVGEDNHKTLSLIIRNNKDEIIGGLVGGTYWGWLYIDRFWINEKYRNQGLGKNIIKIAEEEAKMRGCKKAQVDTHDFQAFDFYAKQGYKTICEIKDFPKGHCKYIMIREL